MTSAALSTSAESRRSAEWRAWFKTVTLAEFVGFGAPAVAGAVTTDASAAVTYLSLVLAGAIEGTILGFGQASVLAHMVAGFSRRSWVAATAVGAALAWSTAMAPSLFGDQLTHASNVVRALVIGSVATVAVLSIGAVQWLVLRKATERAAEWIFASSIGWCVGLIAFAATAMPLWREGQSTSVIVAIGLLGGLVMAATMAAVTGSFMVRIVSGATTPARNT
ncbi:MAG: hypothetical protein LLG14_09495 [Nocardiaceae bacterium]|nr:hypothetical protein [Nocardiaceae bacterium]